MALVSTSWERKENLQDWGGEMGSLGDSGGETEEMGIG